MNVFHTIVDIVSKDFLVQGWDTDMLNRNVIVPDKRNNSISEDVRKDSTRNREICLCFAEGQTHLLLSVEHEAAVRMASARGLLQRSSGSIETSSLTVTVLEAASQVSIGLCDCSWTK